MDEKEQPAIVSLVASVGSANLFQGCGRTGRESDGKWRKGRKKRLVPRLNHLVESKSNKQFAFVGAVSKVVSAVCSSNMVSSGA